MDHIYKNKCACMLAGSDVHVLQQGSQLNNHVVVRAPCKVVAASLVTSLCTSHTFSVIIATYDNQIWLASTKCPQKDDFTRRTENNQAKSNEVMDTEDIFRNLLNNEDQSKASQADFDHPKVKIYAPQSDHVFTLKSQHLLFTVDGVIIDVDTVNDLVSVLVDRAGIVQLHSFKLHTEQQVGVIEGGYQLILLECIETGLDSSSFQNMYMKKKCLVFATHMPEINSDCKAASVASDSWMHLQTSVCLRIRLFTILFGKEAACLNSPVVMMCTDKGHVYSHVVKSVNSVHKRLNILCQLDTAIVGIAAVAVSQFIADEKSAFKNIVSALASSLGKRHTSSDTTETETCLVILSATGKGCLFVQSSDYPAAFMFSLPQPVDSFVVHETSIIYNTGKSVEICHLNLVQKQDGSCSVTPVVRTLLRKARIHRLLPFAVGARVDDTMISAVTCNFDVVYICLQERSAQPDAVLETTPSLKDLLGKIEQCSLALTSLERDSLYIDSLLLQLNIFANLVQNISQKELSGSKHCCPSVSDASYLLIACKMSIQSATNAYKRNWNLNIRLENTSSVSLSDDWVVVVTLSDRIEDLHYPTQEGFSQSFSVPLSRGLRCKSGLDISVSLEKLLEIHPTPFLDVAVCLSLSFQDEKRNIPKDLFTKMAKIKIHHEKFDILHFLKLNEPSYSGEDSRVNLSQSNEEWLCNEIHKMAAVRVIKLKECPLQDGSHILSVRVGVSERQCQEHKLNSSSDVLSFFLKDSDIPTDKMLGQHVQLEDPQGHSVTLIVTPSAADVSNKSNGGYLYVVALKGENFGLLLQTRAAIKSRLKGPSSSESALNSQSYKELEKQLTCLEEAQNDLRDIQKMLVTHRKDKNETSRLVCETLDRMELLAKE